MSPLEVGVQLRSSQKVPDFIRHDETTAKESDDGCNGWEEKGKGAAIKEEGKGRDLHVSDFLLAEQGRLNVSKEHWGMTHEDRAGEQASGQVVDGSAVEQYNRRSGIYGGRGQGGKQAVKFVQHAVALLKKKNADCKVKTRTTLLQLAS